MPWITENEKSYWMPEVLPEPTEEYQSVQSEKLYLTHENKERRHPGWTYAETNAYVDDEYLFHNEGWKVIIDSGYNANIEIIGGKLKHAIKNNVEKWEKVNEYTVKVTYSFVDSTQEEIDNYIIQQWSKLRKKRDQFLADTDWIIVKVYEQNLIVNPEVISYRQQLRDFPEVVSNILEFEIDNELLWPSKPEVYFEV
jgi:hypothetical protein